MARLAHFMTFVFMCLFSTAPGVGAEQAVPEFRFVVTDDTDFFGADLQPIFDTDLGACQRACAADRSCAAFTFNSRAKACFPKRGIAERAPYAGAISGQKLATPPAVIARAETRAAELGFLTPGDFDQARAQARDLGLRYRAGGYDLEMLLATGRARAAAEGAEQARGWIAAAVSLSDAGALWTEYADLLLATRPDSASRRRADRAGALSAAINGYLRADTTGAEVAALLAMARALEATERGRAMIGALRLAHDRQPRPEIAAQLDRAIGKYGFRITDSIVDSDSASPRICAEFSEPLVPAGLDYDPFVQRSEAGLAVRAEDRRLCVEGLEHGRRYRLSFRAGLPAESGETLARDVSITHYVRDRNPLVRFPGRSYVLAKSAEAALPVETVNTDRLDLRLRRVSDRNLLRTMQDGMFGRPLTQWQDESFARDIAQEVWTGTAEVGNTLNRETVTRLPLGAAIAGQPAGIYALSARVPGTDPYDVPGATQWFVLSDLGLSTLSGSDGLHVALRGLSDAAPRAGVTVSLISRANAVLGTAVTDAQGAAHFGPGLTRGAGGAAPALVLADDGAGDIGFLSLLDPAFDLSDRGVEGRKAPGPVDVFLTTDRGAYRAGETVHATALARDGRAAAIEGLPLIAVLSRPDGVEYARRVSGAGQAGGHVFAFAVDRAAPRGTWTLDIHTDPDAPALASQTLLVEDFLPERIDFEMRLPPAPLRPGDRPPLQIAARYLFGAPGADLGIEGEVRLRPVRELAGWPGFRFGRHDAPQGARSSHFGGARTDAGGKAALAIEIPQPEAETARPMQATVIARLADGAARPVERRLEVPVAPAGPVIGLRPLFEDVVAEGTEARFELVALGADLAPAPMRLRWVMNRVETRYQWYQLYGDWQWEPVVSRSRVASGEVLTGAAPVAVSAPVEWGEYELVVERIDGAHAAASVAFEAGWYAAADAAATPDRLDMSLDRDRYAVGDTARLRILARAPGTALVSVLSDRVIARQAVTVAAGETVIPLPVTADWGAGAYVSATLVRPLSQAAERVPTRALGLAHAAIDPGARALSVTIEAPPLARPRGRETLRLRVEGAAPGDPAWVTLAAVDQGILNLTGFADPDPQGHYFGQRRLGVELRDLYGRLIDASNGAMGRVRSGGDDGAGMRMQAPPPQQDLVALFSGPVALGADGTAEIALDLPAFNGTVRLMAVAWNRTGLGQAAAEMIVRDPVVVTATTPRFLAPGDRARIRLDLAHADGPAGAVGLSLTAPDAGLELGAVPDRLHLAEGGRQSFDIPVAARTVGDHRITLALTTPDGTALTRQITLPVRANDPALAATRRFSLAAGDRFLFDDDVFAGLRPGTARALISAGPLARFDVPGLLARLDRYPYGCTEQITSQALPLLYLSAVAEAAGLGEGPALRARIDAAITRVLTRQAGNGGFGLWRAESGDFWLDAYVTDFLSRARAEGHAVPPRAFAQALDNLRNRISYAPDFDATDPGGQDLAYALMVLAREGAAAMGDLRYYADQKADALATPLAAAQLGAALAAYGDQARADALFARAARMLAGAGDDRAGDYRAGWRSDYGTALRDGAAVLTLAAESGSTALDRAALSARVGGAEGPLSTQEAGWSLLAAHALIADPARAGLAVDGAPVTGPFVELREAGRGAPPLAITATAEAPVDLTLTTIGVPEIAPPAGGHGYAIARRYYTMEGAPLDPGATRVGDRFVTVLSVTPTEGLGGRLMVDDPLPAGFEIDNPSLLRSGDLRALDWLDLTEARHAEFRAERFLAAVDAEGTAPITLAYVARAVTPGQFHHPAASVEDMYRPRLRARTETGRIEVRP